MGGVAEVVELAVDDAVGAAVVLGNEVDEGALGCGGPANGCWGWGG